MRRYLPYLFVLGLLMVSCVRDVEIDLEDLPDRIVLNASVCPGKEVCAHLSKTWFIMDSVPDFELSDAKVRVYVNDEFQGLMRNDDLPEDSIHSRGQYVLPGCFVRQGDCLRIEAEADGYEPVSGKTRIPGRARIYDCMGVFRGEDLVNTNAIKVSVFPVEYSYESDTLSMDVHYDVRLLSISEDYYRYMKIMRGYSITIGDANFGALIEPADTYSNVENGFGIVAGYQEDKLRITMPRDTVPPYWNPWDG